jgi:serine O-acetyltransferase
MFENIRADLVRRRLAYKVRAGDQSFFHKYIKANLELGAIAQLVFRYGNWAVNLRIPVVRQILYGVYWILNMGVLLGTGVNIQSRCKIGKGFIVHNFSCIFIWTTSMGENCTVNQGVTIGSIKGSTVSPQIGNNVFFGSGCKVLGPVKIGNNVIIAANSLVITDVPDNCTVIGVPARIVSRDAKSEYLKV